MGFRIKVLILAAVLLLGVTGAAFASGKLPVNLGSVAGLGGPETSGSGDDSAVAGQIAGYEDDEDEAGAGESAAEGGYGTDDDATEVDDDNEVDDDDATEVEDDEGEIDDDDESNVTPPAPGNTAYSRDDDDDEDEADDSTSHGTVGSGSNGSGVSPTSSAPGSDGQSRNYRPEPRERD